MIEKSNFRREISCAPCHFLGGQNPIEELSSPYLTESVLHVNSVLVCIVEILWG